MSVGYSGRPLMQKLGLKAGHRMAVVDPPDNYWKLLGRLPDDVAVLQLPRAQELDFIHIFQKDAAKLRRQLERAKSRMAQVGMIWVSWPKKASKVKTDITEDEVRKLAFANGLVDIKVCAVDEIWSGLKLVIRSADRK